MKRWDRLLAALLAGLLFCALPLAALAELEIDLEYGASQDPEGKSMEFKKDSDTDAAQPEINMLDLSETAPVETVSDPRGNDGDEDFDFDENGVVVGYHGPGGDITIPATATAIGEWSIYGNDTVTGVTIPGNVNVIGQGCFGSCPNLTRVTIENGPTVICHVAFGSCPKLEEIKIPDSVTLIDGAAFNECTGLKKLTLGKGLEVIEFNAFENCTSLTKVTIPGNVKRIGETCFRGCSALTSLTLQDGVETIEQEAFMECTSLKSVTIPGSLKTVHEKMFKGCTALKTAKIEKGVRYLYDDVFAECSSLNSVTLPEGLKLVGQGTFFGCAALTDVKIPDSVEEIESYAFAFCGLKSATIPAGVKTIGGNPFEGCRRIQKINVASGNKHFVSLDGVVYTKDKKTVRCCPSGKDSVKILDGVTAIGDNAFAGCEQLKSMEIPRGVKTIGDNALKDCTALKSVTLYQGLKSIGECAFEGCEKLKRLEIPEGAKTIGESAFYSCIALEQVVIPASVTSIGDCAFCYERDGEEYPLKVTLIVEAGSYAHKYAKREKFAVLINLAKAKVIVKDQVYTGKNLQPDVKVVLNKKTLRSGKDYKVSYKDNKAVGTAAVIITGKGGYAGTATGAFSIFPASVTGLKLTPGTKRLTANWDKAQGITGYQLQYSLKKTFKSAKTATINKAAATTKTLKGLQSGKTYYVRIRAFKKVGGKKYWSAWSAAKKARVK